MASNRIDDGFSTTVSFANDPTLKIYEKEVTPPSMDGGGANDTTTMRNSTLRTKAPKKLKSMDEITFKASYATNVYTSVWAMINVNQLITVTFPDTSTLAVWGWINMFKPDAVKEGSQPEATVTVILSNQNASGVETAPVYVSA